MMRISALFVASVLGVLGASEAVASSARYIVARGDTLTGIAAKHPGTTPAGICRANPLSNCDQIEAGQNIDIPLVGEAPPTDAAVFRWKKVGGDPVVDSGKWHRGGGDGNLTLTQKQRRQVTALGIDAEQVDRDLKAGRCNADTRPTGYKWRNMGSRRGLVGRPTVNATGYGVDVWACPTIDIAMGCGNPLPRYEEKPPPAPETQMAERVISCERIATLSAQGGSGDKSWGVNTWNKAGCLFDVGKGVQFGPVVGFVAGRYGDKTNKWGDRTVSGFLGGELRIKPFMGMQALEIMAGAGPGCSGGGNADVKRPWKCGAVAEFSAQLRDEFKIAENTTLQWRLFAGARLPFGGNNSPILWRGQEVGRSFSITPTAWVEGRIALRNPTWPVNPRLTVGVFRTWGTQFPWGAKALIGVENPEETLAVDVGIECVFGAGCMPIARVIWDPTLGRWIVARERVALALTDGAKSSATSLGVEARPSDRGLAATYAARQHAQAKAHAKGRADTVTRRTNTHNGRIYGGFNPEPDRSEVRDPKPSTPAQIAATNAANSGPFNCFAASSGCGG